MFTFSTPLWQTLAAAAVLVATGLAAWLAPHVMEFIFGRILGLYLVHHTPPLEEEEDPRRAHEIHIERYHHGRASRWRTDFWKVLTAALVLYIVLTGLIVAYWMVHDDFWQMLTWSLGVGGIIALVSLSPFFAQAFAYFIITLTGGPVRVSDYVEVGTAYGEIAAIRPLYTELRGYYELTGASAPAVVDANIGQSAPSSVVEMFRRVQTESLRGLDDSSSDDDRENAANRELSRRVRAQTARSQNIPNTWLLFQSIRVHPARLHVHQHAPGSLPPHVPPAGRPHRHRHARRDPEHHDWGSPPFAASAAGHDEATTSHSLADHVGAHVAWDQATGRNM